MQFIAPQSLLVHAWAHLSLTRISTALQHGPSCLIWCVCLWAHLYNTVGLFSPQRGPSHLIWAPLMASTMGPSISNGIAKYPMGPPVVPLVGLCGLACCIWALFLVGRPIGYGEGSLDYVVGLQPHFALLVGLWPHFAALLCTSGQLAALLAAAEASVAEGAALLAETREGVSNERRTLAQHLHAALVE